jgi:hypothetical protein
MAESLRRCSGKIMAAANAYRRHCTALETLDPEGDWSTQLKVLRDEDIRGINERALTAEEARSRDISTRLQQAVDALEEDMASSMTDDVIDELHDLPVRVITTRETGEGRRAISWIWHNTPALNERALTSADPRLMSGQVSTFWIEIKANTLLTIALRTEWAKSKIRTHHWKVQLLLVCKEMRRSLEFATWKAKTWRQDGMTATGDEAMLEGKQAYALRHAEAYEGLHAKWAKKWHPLVEQAKKTRFKGDVEDLGVEISSNSVKVVIDIEESDYDDNVEGNDGTDDENEDKGGSNDKD